MDREWAVLTVRCPLTSVRSACVECDRSHLKKDGLFQNEHEQVPLESKVANRMTD